MTLFFYAMLLAVSVFIQGFLANNFSIFSFSPDVVLLCALAVCVFAEPAAAFVMCFLWGLYSDMTGSGPAGAHALLYTFMCYAVFLLKRHFDFRSLVPQIVLAFLASVFFFFAHQFLALIFAEIEYFRLSYLFVMPLLNAAAMPVAAAANYYFLRKFKTIP